MNNKSIILAVTALALAVSCNVMQEESLPLPQKVTFQAVLCDTPPTKTALQSNGAVYWTTGDAINIFYKDNISAKLASDSTATAASAQTSFSGVLEDLVPNGSDYFWAVYPYSGSTTYDGSSVTVTLPSEQYGTPGTFADDLFISMARSMDYTLQFYNLCGGIKFRVANQGIRLVTFAGNNSEILAGQVQATFNSEGKPVVLENLKGATTLRLHSPDDDGFEVGKWYYIVSLPATLSAGYTMTFYNASNEEIAKRVTDTSVSIRRSIWGRLTDADVVAETITVSKYLTFTSTGTTTVSLTNEEENAPVLYYSTDAQNWAEWDYSELTFTADAPLYICGDNPSRFSASTTKYSHFTTSGDLFAVSGSIMSLLNKDEELLTIPSDYYCFMSLFQDCTNLTTPPQLPATTLGMGCYANMFNGCTSLSVAPVLPALKMENSCYYQLLRNCTSLTVAPELPATELASGCYTQLFYGCSSLTTAPELPSLTLATSCYSNMFRDCTGLTTAPALPATELMEECYFCMFWGCTSLTTAPELQATTLVKECYSRMFVSCSKLEYVKCLATDISAEDCVLYWLSGASSSGTFIKAPQMNDWPTGTSGIPSGWTVENADGSAAISVSKYLTFTSTGSTTISLTNEGGNAPVLYYSTDAQNWTQWDYSGLTFTEAAPLYLCGDNPEGFGTAYDKYSTFVAEGSSFAVSGDIMSLISMNSDVLTIPSNYCFASLFKNCTGLTAAPSLSATSFVGTSNCYDSMFSGCVGLVSAPELPATELGENCYEEMFRGCTGLTTAPALPATELTSGCYWGMFWDCTALASAPELSAVTMASACYAWMFSDCTSLEEMPDLPATTLASQCYHGMFYGCTGLVSSIPSLPASTLSEWCYAEMFAYCSNLATAPYLDAPVLAENCYKEMFKGCTSLEYLRCLATDNSATGCTDSWLDSASTSGYFIKDASMTDWPQGTSGIPSGWTVQNSDGSPLMTASKYLTLTSTGSSEVYVDNSGSNAPVLYYSYNLVDWILWEDYSNLSFTANRPIYICGVNPEGFSVNQSSRSTIKFSGDYYAVSGDIMSLIDKDEDVVEIPSDYCFYYLFNSDLNMTSGPSLTATTLRPHCYEGMFSSCFALTVAPELPSMELTESCYAYMFSSCSGLLTAPELPATTLAANCYYDMFYYCTSMKSAPATLPATVLAQGCYSRMFESCHSIASGPSLPATSLADQCYMAMFTDCRGLVEAPALPADTLATSCYHSMFAGCTSLTVAPDLPAENLTESCYEQMFGSCSGLTTAQAILPSTTLASACYQAMFSGCSSLSTAPELPAPVVATNAYNTMFNQCTSLNFVKCMAYDISASSCVSLWMNNVAATGTFVKTANSQWPTGESGIPEGWTVEIGD